MRALDAPERSATPRPWELIAVALLLVLHAGLIWMLRSPPIVTASDPAWYILLSRALQDFAYVNLQFADLTPHTKYPPAYPALLALLDVTSFDRFDRAVAANAVLSAAALGATYATVRRLTPTIALLSLLATSVNPLLIASAGSVLSEPLYLLLAAVAVYALDHESPSPRSRALVVAALVLASLTRSAGVSAVLAALVLWSIRKEWRWVITLATASTICVGGWLLWSALATPSALPGQSYLADALYRGRSSAIPTRDSSPAVAQPPVAQPPVAQPPVAQPPVAQPPVAAPPSLAGTVLRRVASHGRTIAARTIPEALALPVRATSRGDAAMWLMIATFLAGAGALALGARIPALLLVSAGALGLLIVWPYLLIRYLAPLVPAMLTVLVAGAHLLGVRLGWRAGWQRVVAPVVVTVVLTGAAVAKLSDTLSAVRKCDRSIAATSLACVTTDQRDYFAAVAAVRQLPDDNATFLVSQEAPFHLLTGRYAAWEAEAATLREPAALLDYLRHARVGYVVLSRTNLNQWSLARPLEGLCQHLAVVRRFGTRAALLRFAPDSTFAPDGCGVVASWAEPPWPDAPGLIW